MEWVEHLKLKCFVCTEELQIIDGVSIMIFGHLKCIQIPLEIYIRVSKSGLKKDRTTGPKITFLNRLVIIIKPGLYTIKVSVITVVILIR